MSDKSPSRPWWSRRSAADRQADANPEDEETTIDSTDPHAGANDPPPAAPLVQEWTPGKIVADIYQVERELGRGGMSVVYLLRERGTGRQAAVKRPLQTFLINRHLREDFTREATLWTALDAHPNIIRAYEVQEIDYLPCILMEYADGGSVSDRLRRSGSKLPMETVLSLAIQTCWAIAFAHEKQYVHLDLKPANLLLTAQEVVKVTDFGLVSPVDAEDDSHRVVGTRQYMAPELWEGHASPATDLYAFGVTLFELCCGQRPFDPRTHPSCRGTRVDPRVERYVYQRLHQQEEPLDPATFRRGLPQPLRRLILCCLAKNPQQRPPGCREIATELIAVYRQLTGHDFPLAEPTSVTLDRQSRQDRAWSLIRLGLGCQFRGDLEEVLPLYQESEQLFHELHDLAGLAACAINQGLLLMLRGRYTEATARFDTSFALAQAFEDGEMMAKCHLNAARVLMNQHRFGEAAARLQQGLALSREIGDRATVAAFELNLGAIAYEQRQYDEARNLIHQALSGYQEMGDRAGMAACYLGMGNIQLARRDGQGALVRYQQSLKIRIGLGDQAGSGECHLNLGIAYSETGDAVCAVDAFEQCLAIAERLHDHGLQARLHNNLGSLLIRLRRLDDAEAHLEQCLRLARQAGDPANLANGFLNLGVLSGARGQFEQATEHYHASLTIRQELGDRVGMADCYLLLGNALFRQSHLARAVERYRQALDIRRDQDDDAGIAECLYHLGLVYRAQDDLATAGELLQESLRLRNLLSDPSGAGQCLLQLAGMAHQRHEYAEALRLYQEALTCCGDNVAAASCHLGMGLASEQAGDFPAALEHFTRALALEQQHGLPVPEWLPGKLC